MDQRVFGDLLREFRVAAELSQETLAERARLSSGAISALERNARRGPQQQTLALLADALALTPSQRAQLDLAAKAGRRRGVRSTPPSERIAATAIATNLPYALTSFHGRNEELIDLDGLLLQRRLVTIVGPGGVGKTRLAIESAHRHLDARRFADGVWFIDLLPANSGDAIASAIARTLNLAEIGTSSVMERLRAVLAGKRQLLILDNCEHIAPQVAAIAATLLRDTPELRLIATSRETLRVDGECAVRVKPLATSSDSGRPPALELLIDRLIDADYTTYTKMSTTHEALAWTICRRLDGLPLAMELAAARAGELTLAQIADGLDARFALLDGDRRTAARHSTLHDTIAWSYELLAPNDQTLFARLGIFRDTFSGEIAVDVCGEEFTRPHDLLRTLVTKSLVSVVELADGAVRYRLLESTREFALERLREAGSFDRYAGRFATAFCRLAQAADARFRSVSKSDFIASVEPDLENYRGALEWTLGGGRDVAAGASLAGAMGWIFRQTALFIEGTRWAERALEQRAQLEPRVVGRLQLAISYYSFNRGMMQGAFDAAEAAVVAYREAGAKSELAWALTQWAYTAYRLGSIDIVRCASTEAVAIARAERDDYRLASALNAYALGIPQDRSSERLAILEEAIACSRAGGNHDAIVPTAHLAAAYHEANAFDKAVACGEEVVNLARMSNDRAMLAGALGNFATYAIAVHDVDRGFEAAHESLGLVRDLGKTLMTLVALQHLADIAIRRGSFVRGARLAGFVDALVREFGIERDASEQRAYDTMIDAVRSALGEEALARHHRAGALLDIARAIAEGLTIEEHVDRC